METLVFLSETEAIDNVAAPPALASRWNHSELLCDDAIHGSLGE